MKKFLRTSLLVLLVGTLGTSWAATKTKAATTKAAPAAATKTTKSDGVARDPYLGAIVVDAADGRVILEDNADARGYPASMLKLMTFLIVLEKIDQGAVKLSDPITVSAEVSQIGGSQVYLKQGEVFSVEELLYAMVVPSANDAATALALHVAGSTPAFVELMNQHAAALGMNNTVFQSVHGLPPSSGQKPDVTTARDFARLCLELLKHKETLKYTATEFRLFRPQAPKPFEMRTHNHLLENYRGVKPHNFKGCDGLKTGFYHLAGYSMAVTAHSGEARVLVVILDSVTAEVRDAKARELMSKGLADIAAWRAKHPVAPAPAPALATNRTTAAQPGLAPQPPAPPQPMTAAPPMPPEQQPSSGMSGAMIAVIALSGVVVILTAVIFVTRRPRDPLG